METDFGEVTEAIEELKNKTGEVVSAFFDTMKASSNLIDKVGSLFSMFEKEPEKEKRLKVVDITNKLPRDNDGGDKDK